MIINVLIFFSLLTGFCYTTAFAQDPFQLYISSYDNVNQAAFFCQGVRQNEVQFDLALVNLKYTSDPEMTVDSLVFVCDTSIFKNVQTERNLPVSEITMITGIEYLPNKVGVDTLTVIGYYGPYTSIGTIVCHAKESPSLGFYGFTFTDFDLGGGESYSIPNYLIKSDTLHDKMNNGALYVQSTTPQPKGTNDAVEVRACGSVTIDSIYTIGDFSEFHFINLPTAPVQLSAGDKLTINYDFTPSIVGKHQRLLVIHTTNGQYLVWSFEYQVKAQNAVTGEDGVADDISIYPNPASHQLTIKTGTEAEFAIISVFDANGNLSLRKAMTEEEILDVSSFPSGSYTLWLSRKSGVVSKRFIVAR
jgi:hypothetical protein